MKKIIKSIGILIIPVFIFSCNVIFNDKEIVNINKNSYEETKPAIYVLGSDDIPLFEGLKQSNDDLTSFDTPSGNIAISTYNGQLELNEVKVFYLSTLPQLGWEVTSNKNNILSYKRNHDTLKISFKRKDGQLIAKFFISSSL